MPAVPGVAPCEGWTLVYEPGSATCDDPCNLPREYAAVKGDQVVSLGVSRWRFTPTTGRFAWLVQAGFPMAIRNAAGTLVPLCDADIDAALAAEAVPA